MFDPNINTVESFNKYGGEKTTHGKMEYMLMKYRLVEPARQEHRLTLDEVPSLVEMERMRYMDNNNTTTTTTESEYLCQENEAFRAEAADLTRKLNQAITEYDVLKLEHQLIREYDLWEVIGDEKLEGNILASVAGASDLADMLCKEIKTRATGE